MAEVELEGITKQFGKRIAVNGISFTVPSASFFSLLGPSGCGKSTTLRIIGGFESPDSGALRIGGSDMEGVAPNRRPTNMVFQRWALFPHMTVWQNVAFGLEVERLGRKVIRDRVRAMLELVGLTDRAEYKPGQLSGGQMQRVALARALVKRPRVLLLDEPLAALDLKLRKQLQLELKRIQKEVGAVFIYVTHDQGEAMTMSDRIAVMRDGCIDQIGPPREIYDRPATPFVAAFIGNTNLFPVIIREVRDDLARVSVGDHIFLVTARQVVPSGCRGHVSIRCERIRLGAAARELGVNVRAQVREVTFSGSAVQYCLGVDGSDLMLTAEVGYDGASSLLEVGGEVAVGWDPAAAQLFIDT